MATTTDTNIITASTAAALRRISWGAVLAGAEAEQMTVEVAKKKRAVADQTADAISTAPLWAFCALLLGASAAAVGGARRGHPRSALTRPL